MPTRRSDASEKPHGNVQTLLETASELLRARGPNYRHLAGRIDELASRLATGRFHLAVLGQFKRGKSTLVNALLGEEVLPTAVLPLTAIPTFLRPGPVRTVKVSFLDGQAKTYREGEANVAEVLYRYVTEEQNPANRLGVAQVEVEHPAPFLARGVVLIDTPGIGSTLAHNTQATMDFLPQCDAALFVVSADPPITAVEVEFLQAVRDHVARLFFVLNKVDYLTADEREQATVFLRRVLREKAGIAGDPEIFAISARQGLQARQRHDERAWKESGLGRVESYLFDFLAREKTQALRQAVTEKARDVIAEAEMQVDLELQALEVPLSDLESRRGLLQAKMAEVERERVTFGDLLAGDRKRAVAYLEDLAAKLREKATHHFQKLVEKALNEHAADPGEAEKAARQAIADEVPRFFDAEKAKFTADITNQVDTVLAPHIARADELIESIRRTAAELFRIPYRPVSTREPLQRYREPYWVESDWSTPVTIVPPGAVDRLLPAGVRMRRLRERLGQEVETVVRVNVEHLRWASLQNLEQTFRQFGSRFDERLAEVVSATAGAVQAAQERRVRHAETVAATVAELHATRTRLSELSEALAEGE